MAELADKRNKENGVTMAQRSCMEWGCICGVWDMPLTNIDNYNENGFFIRESQQQ